MVKERTFTFGGFNRLIMYRASRPLLKQIQRDYSPGSLQLAYPYSYLSPDNVIAKYAGILPYYV